MALLLLVMVAPLVGQEPGRETRTTLHGVVVDAANGDPLPNSIVVLVDENLSLLSDSLGRFRFANVQIGPQLLAVKQYGYDETNIHVDVVAGQEPLRVELRPGPLALEGFTVVADRLATMSRSLKARRNAFGGSVRALDQRQLANSSAWTVTEFLQREGGLQLRRCGSRTATSGCVWRRGTVSEPRVYIDEAFLIGGLDFLAMYHPYELHLVEVYSAGREIRAYTHSYVERLAGRPGMLWPIGL
jgi:hypothetical protein